MEAGQVGGRHSCQGVEAGVSRADQRPGCRRTYPSRQIDLGFRAHGMILARRAGGSNLNDGPNGPTIDPTDHTEADQTNPIAALRRPPNGATSYGSIADLRQVRGLD